MMFAISHEHSLAAVAITKALEQLSVGITIHIVTSIVPVPSLLPQVWVNKKEK